MLVRVISKWWRLKWKVLIIHHSLWSKNQEAFRTNVRKISTFFFYYPKSWYMYVFKNVFITNSNIDVFNICLLNVLCLKWIPCCCYEKINVCFKIILLLKMSVCFYNKIGTKWFVKQLTLSMLPLCHEYVYDFSLEI